MVALEYDIHASYYFGISMILVFLVPLTMTTLWIIAKALLPQLLSDKAKIRKKALENAKTIVEKKKLEDIHLRESDLRKNLLSTSMIIRYGFIVVLSLCLIILLRSTSNEENQIAQFDPFQILGISSDATDKEIKKAYRALSLTLHPDKWVTATKAEQAVASAKFMKVSKAYETLTDDVAKENYKKYGNPDGPQALAVSIGIPPWIVDKANQNLILFLYLISLIVIIPGIVGIYYSRSQKYAERSILRESLEVLNFYIKNNPKVKNLPEAIAVCHEFRVLRDRDENETKLLTKLMGRMCDQEKMVKPNPQIRKYIDSAPGALKTLVLLHVHMNRLTNELTPELKQDLEYILSCIPMLLDEMQKIAQPTLNFRSMNAVLKLGQHIYQATYFTDSGLLQLPHMTEKEIKHALGAGGKNKKQSGDDVPTSSSCDIDQYILHNATVAGANDKPARRKGLADMTAEQADEVENMLRSLPTLTKIVTRLGTVKEIDTETNEVTEWETSTVQGDTVTLVARIMVNHGWDKTNFEGLESIETTVSLKHTKGKIPSRKSASETRYAYTPHFPGVVEEKWYAIMTGGAAPVGGEYNYPSGQDRVMGFAELTCDSSTKFGEAVLRFRTEYVSAMWHQSSNYPLGNNTITLHIMPNCYVKFDQVVQLQMKLEAKKAEDDIQVHPEDEALDSQPTLWDELRRTKNQSEHDEDFEEVNGNADVDEDFAEPSGPAKGPSRAERRLKLKGKSIANANNNSGNDSDNEDDGDEDDEEEYVLPAEGGVIAPIAAD